MLDAQIAFLQDYAAGGDAVPRHELQELVWQTVKKTRGIIEPSKGGARLTAWTHCKGMLKNIIDFNRFSVLHEDHSCVADVLENQVMA